MSRDAAGLFCDGCKTGIPHNVLDSVTYHPGPNREVEHYHQSCWMTGWYTDIEPKGEWPIHKGKPPADLPGGDPVNSPSHYRWLPNGVEVIDITENFDFLMGNVLKYVLRAEHKGKPLEDMKKARWYLDRAIAKREAQA